jgi:ectoine hydroxylase-related dioxygenase (phytanoyl-CoA dioxygenase family)
MATTVEKQAAPWLGGRSFASWREEFDRRGYLIFERVLPQDRVAEIRAALAPHLARDLKGRNCETSDRADAIKMMMPSGSLAITKGTLWHRGGANRSDHPRLIVTPQYCVGWVRQLENMCLAVPPEIADKLPERVRELIGYSIHPPFMGHVDGLHPRRLLRLMQFDGIV